MNFKKSENSRTKLEPDASKDASNRDFMNVFNQSIRVFLYIG